jgi:hypothetical protein
VKVGEHIYEVEKLIVNSPIIRSFQIKERWLRRFDAYIKVRVNLIDDSILEITQFLHADEENYAEIKRYNYHWMDSSNRLRRRWDNVRHYPDLPNFPHHHHDGDEKNVLPGEPMNLFKVLDIIAEELNQKKTTSGRQ